MDHIPAIKKKGKIMRERVSVPSFFEPTSTDMQISERYLLICQLLGQTSKI